MTERALSILKTAVPLALAVVVLMNLLAYTAMVTIDKPVEVISVAAGPQRICGMLASKDALPDWFSWIDQAEPATVVRKNYIVPTFEQEVYRFRPDTDRAGKYFDITIEKSDCEDGKPMRVEMQLRYVDAGSLAARTQDYQPFIRMPFRALGDFDIEYTLHADGGDTRIGYIVRSCIGRWTDNPTGCWGELELTFIGMFEPYYRWPIETTIGDSLRKFKALVEGAG